MIKLFQFSPVWGLPNASGFCMKLETYMRMTDLPYEIVKTNDPRKAPVGKLPYIEDKGKIYYDSDLIMDYLKKTYGDPLDARLSQRQKAEALAFQRLMEDHLYWAIVYSRWFDQMNWPIMKNLFFGKRPSIKRTLISMLVRKKIRREIDGHGLGRLSQDEIYKLGVEDLTALSAILSERPFLLGDSPTSIDACGYAFIANVLFPPIESPIKTYAKSQSCFSQYCERMKERYYK